MIKEKIIEKAALQILSEAVGYDEAKAYYFLLAKRGEKFEGEFSYSKRYRLLKNLFNSRAVGKFKSEDKEIFNYFPLPPSFLHFEEANIEVINFLEQIYIKNYFDLVKTPFSQIMLKDEKGFIIFLLKHYMKENAKILANNLDLKILGDDFNKIIIKSNSDNGRKIGIIDGQIFFEFTKIRSIRAEDHIGWIAFKKDSEENEFIGLLEREMRSLIN